MLRVLTVSSWNSSLWDLNQSNLRAHSSWKQYFLPFFAILVQTSDSASSSELGFDSGTLLDLLGRKSPSTHIGCHQWFQILWFAPSTCQCKKNFFLNGKFTGRTCVTKCKMWSHCLKFWSQNATSWSQLEPRKFNLMLHDQTKVT